jgi:hypothetical protein
MGFDDEDGDDGQQDEDEWRFRVARGCGDGVG